MSIRTAALAGAPLLALLALLALAAPAMAQVPTLVNGNLDEPDPFFLTFPKGWRLLQAGQTEYRMLGDGLSPPTVTHSGMYSVRLPGGEGRANGEYQGLLAEELVDQSNVLSPRNWPQYTFNPPSGAPLTVSCWINIPASDPVVGSKVGMKLSLIRSGNNFSHYQEFEWQDLDPDAATPFPGTTIVTLPSNRKGIHTGGQWIRLQHTLNQSDIGSFPEPPTNPARASFQTFRVSPDNTSTGSVFVDDMAFSQGAACKTDFNNNGSIDLLDIFAFLSAWFAGDPRADYNGMNGVDLLDIFAFLNNWFANSCG
jgi:hypothetical protein